MSVKGVTVKADDTVDPAASTISPNPPKEGVGLAS